MRTLSVQGWGRGFLAAAAALSALGCVPQQRAATDVSRGTAWMDATATLDPATTPVYEGDAPMTFTFLKDMRRGDPLTLSSYAMGAHSGTHIDAPMHFVSGGAPIDKVPLEDRKSTRLNSSHRP